MTTHNYTDKQLIKLIDEKIKKSKYSVRELTGLSTQMIPSNVGSTKYYVIFFFGYNASKNSQSFKEEVTPEAFPIWFEAMTIKIKQLENKKKSDGLEEIESLIGDSDEVVDKPVTTEDKIIKQYSKQEFKKYIEPNLNDKVNIDDVYRWMEYRKRIKKALPTLSPTTSFIKTMSELIEEEGVSKELIFDILDKTLWVGFKKEWIKKELKKNNNNNNSLSADDLALFGVK